MKTLVTLTLLLICATAHGLTLTWDLNDETEKVTKYTLYEKGTTGLWLKVKDILAPNNTVTLVVSSTKVYSITATDARGIESLKSAELMLLAPTPPKNLRVQE